MDDALRLVAAEALMPAVDVPPPASPGKRPRPQVEEEEDPLASPAKRARTEPEASSGGDGTQPEPVEVFVPTPEEVQLSPFNPEHPKFHMVCTVLETHVIPFLPAQDAGHLAQQSRAMNECVDHSARVCLEQIMHFLRTRELCKRAVGMVERFLKDPFTTATDVMAIVVSSVLNNADADVACEVVSYIMSQPLLRHLGKTRNTFKLLAMEATRDRPWNDASLLSELQGAWTHGADGQIRESASWPRTNNWQATEARKVMGAHRCPVVKKTFMRCMKDTETDPQTATLDDVGNALTCVLGRKAFGTKERVPVARTRVSDTLLKLMLSSGIVTPITWLAQHRDAFIASIVVNVAALEADRQDTGPEVSAVDFILDTCEFNASGNDMSETARQLAHTAILAPLIEKVRPNVSKSTSRRSSPITLAIKKGNATSLRSIARLAVSQNVSVMAQKRAMELAMDRKAFVCLRVLVEEGFVVSPSIIKCTILAKREAWGTIDRNTAFDTLLTNVEVLAARERTGLAALVKQFHTPLSVGTIDGATAFDTWTAVIAGEFLCAFWRATDCKGAVRDRAASTPEFRELVDIALTVYVFHMLRTAGHDALSVSPMAKGLMSRISELFDIQWRCTDVFQPATDSGRVSTAASAASGPTQRLYGIMFDVWLLSYALPRIAVSSWKIIQLMISMDPTCASCVVASVVYTDNLIRCVFHLPGEEPPKENTIRDVLLAAVELDPDTNSDGADVILARRVLRWAGMFKVDPMRAKVTVGHVGVLEELASRVEDTIPVVEQDITTRLDAVIRRMHDLLATTYEKPLGGVQRLYCEYGGDVDAAMLDLYDQLEDKRSTVEPTGDIRDVLVYAMSGPKEVDVDQKTILDTVVKYTACVTLPCVSRLRWLVTTGAVSETLPTPWIRNVLRGTRPYVRWWATQ